MPNRNKSREMVCVSCDNTYTKIGQHWRYNPEHRPDFTQRQLDILRGLLMGDATLLTNGTNPAIRLSNTNIPFINWVDRQLDGLNYGMRLGREEEPPNKAQYRLQTVSHPQLSRFKSWYSTGQKRFPDDIISATTAAMWYACDGSFGSDNTLLIASMNESDRISDLESLFPIDASGSNGCIYLKRDQFLDWIPEAPDGMEHKWASSRAEYENQKKMLEKELCH